MSTTRCRHCRLCRPWNAPLLAVFGELDTPEGVKANVRAIRQILDQAVVFANTRRRLVHSPFTIHHLPATSASNDSHRVSSKRWSTGRQHIFVGVHQQGVRPLMDESLQPPSLHFGHWTFDIGPWTLQYPPATGIENAVACTPKLREGLVGASVRVRGRRYDGVQGRAGRARASE